MKVHFIAIGGSAMHNLAIALHHKGYRVTGSDDEIFEPSRSRLQALGLLPATEGWDADRITPDLDAVILGMHSKKDNPELERAKKLGLKMYSYPEYLYEQSKNKTRIVIGGSHGKTTITAMILHVMQARGISCDYMVGAQLEGFDVMVKLTENAPYMVIEGDEYLTSPLDPRPKFHLYNPDIALISGIAWDHINVFPTWENYVEQFTQFIRLITPGGTLLFCEEDPALKKISLETREDIEVYPYGLPEFVIRDGVTVILSQGLEYPLRIFGRHNLLNLNGARLVCRQVGIPEHEFYQALTTFKGASKRLELVGKNEDSLVFRDFAHAPSKLMATIRAVREQFPAKNLVACMELHTYSSLNSRFLSEYLHAMDQADRAIVYFSPHALELKRLPSISPDEVRQGFGRHDLEVYTDPDAFMAGLSQQAWSNSVLLMMSSGNFDGIDLKGLADRVLAAR